MSSKAYVFKLNGRVIDRNELISSTNFESDIHDLIMHGEVEVEDITGDNTVDKITIEEIEVKE